MPDYLSHTLSVLAGINELGQSNANIEATKQLTDLRSMQTQAIQKEMTEDQRGREALATYYRTQSAKSATDAGAPLDAFAGLTTNDLTRPLVDNMRQEKADATQYRQIAKDIIEQGGSTRLADEYTKRAEGAEAKFKDVYGKFLTAQNDGRSAAAAAAAAYSPDGSNLRDTISSLRQNDPKSLQSASFDRDQDTGEIIPGPGTRRTFETIAKQNLTASQSLRLQQEAEQARENSKRDAKRDEDERFRRDREDRMAANAQAAAERADRRLADSENRTAEMMKRANGKFDEGQFRTTQASIDKVGKEYKAIDYTKAYEVANKVEGALTDPSRGYADVTPATARALADQFKLEIDNFRSRGGTKVGDQEIGRMNGVFQKLDKYVESIGEGDKILAKDVMLQTTREMKDLAASRHADLLKQELGRADSYKRRGGDPTLLQLSGDVDMVVKSGKAKKVTVDGKEWLVFGKDAKDKLPLPTNAEE